MFHGQIKLEVISQHVEFNPFKWQLSYSVLMGTRADEPMDDVWEHPLVPRCLRRRAEKAWRRRRPSWQHVFSLKESYWHQPAATNNVKINTGMCMYILCIYIYTRINKHTHANTHTHMYIYIGIHIIYTYENVTPTSFHGSFCEPNSEASSISIHQQIFSDPGRKRSMPLKPVEPRWPWTIICLNGLV